MAAATDNPPADITENLPDLPPSTLLPPLFNNTNPPPELLTQGAEALLYRTTYLVPSIPCALKHRPSKPYRHPILDARLTKQRILAEARVLAKCRREGVNVPAVYALDWEKGWLLMEWIEGGTVRSILDRWLHSTPVGVDASKRESELKDLMSRVGQTVGELHRAGVVHGDLTTSNLMLKPVSTADDTLASSHEEEGKQHQEQREQHLQGEVVVIDFGLAMQSVQDEDRAVDLYVLERAFGSTHPRAENLFQEVLRAYGESFKGAKVVLRRLEDVRMRGRKKSMIG
ncbi:kinase-like protein [Xylona heveae TC161]|uniref:EKC/KEOPS complex subunit BUD32 n=1 Tax=Xylona heveae (strain CBS 132557 / TC161) TaxID=1328760 RepID=A0A165HII5_XYLHT|nr:kinase-like protein [Xylona heveae TC161]KZF23570.1 kinase-like protein [Xylona heveae TC161]